MARDNDIWMLYSTFAKHDEALYAARTLLDQRLVACATVHGAALSLYRWQDEIRQEAEVILTAKTSKESLALAMEALKKLHPYELPCIIAWPIAEGFPPFLQWVIGETATA